MTVIAPTRPRPVGDGPTPRVRPWWRRPVVMVVLLLGAYWALAIANDPRAFLGTDTGGKVATLRAMDQRGDLDPDLGYWAADLDPDGVVHPIVLNFRVDDAFVNVTTLPMIYAATPLYEIGGLRAILVLPMLGALGTALAARALARRLGGDGDRAFWLIGLATPVLVYALDFWEHTLGLAAMAWGVVLLFDVADGRRAWPAALGGGACFGAAATMRTEALVYALVTFAVLGALTIARRRRVPVVEAVATLGGFGALVVANQVLERVALGGQLRAGRASNAAERVASDLLTRGRDAAVTTVGLNRFAPALDWLLGGCIVALVAVAAVVLVRGPAERRRTGYLALVGAGVGYVVWIGQDLGFLPGVLTASPLAVAGLAVAWGNARARPILLVAVLALPVVWAFQYSGGANPQWGGRYVLLSSTLLATAGVVALGTAPRRARAAFVALALAVTVCGVTWLVVRTHAVADAAAEIDRIPDPVVAVQAPHLLREAGAFYDIDQPRLTAENDAELPVAIDVVERSGAERFTLVSRDARPAAPTLGPYRRGRSRTLDFVLGTDLVLTTYERG